MLQVVIAREAVGNLGGLVRQLSLDHFENESRRMMPFSNDMSSCPAKRYMRQKSPQGLHKKVTFKKLCLLCSSFPDIKGGKMTRSSGPVTDKNGTGLK